jgi:hypothetical protein
MECIICSEDITRATGHTVLGCGHEFHAICVARWFCRQEGNSSCPCCRREAGEYEDVTKIGADDTDSDEEEDEDEDEDEDSESLISVEIYWQRDAAGGWKQLFRETPTTTDWDPVTEPDDVPKEIKEGAEVFQRLWRGYRVRQTLNAAEALLVLKASVLDQPSHFLSSSVRIISPSASTS